MRGVAVPTGKHDRKQYYRFTVSVVDGELASIAQVCHYPEIARVVVHARNSRQAVAHVRQEYNGKACITVTTVGPRGGKYQEYQGWYTAIAQQMAGGLRRPIQEELC